MLVKITNVVSKGDVLEVSFHSLVGNGIALWVGTCPEIGKECEVEVSLDDIFCWGKNIKPSSKNVDQIYSAAGRTYVTAELISMDDEHAAIRINGSIALIELNKAPKQKPAHVHLTTAAIYFYPTNL